MTKSLITFFLVSTSLSFGAVNPSQDTLKTARSLKPISDQEWSQIAGIRASERYSVVPGDSLWDISTRLFGDGNYWPKIWALNNQRITNPHLIRPGYQIAFNPGSGGSLPFVGIQNSRTGGNNVVAQNAAGDPYYAPTNQRSQEWKSLPTQRWENSQIKLPETVDSSGFDRASKVYFHKGSGIALKSIARTIPIEQVGTIESSDEPTIRLTLGHKVYIRSDMDLKNGQIYSITNAEPEVLESPNENERKGFAYLNKGTVRIEKMAEDGLFVGNIESASFVILRGDRIFPKFQRIEWPKLIPGPEPMNATMIVNKEFSTFTTAQHKQVYIDRGTDDGVEIGMVFRGYRNIDPTTEDEITEGNLVRDADFLIVQVSERFSSAIIIHSGRPIEESIRVELLTDISDLTGEKTDEPDEEEEDFLDDEEGEESEDRGDDLDALDDGGDLTDEEKRELEQLEKWEENPPGAVVDEEDEFFEEELEEETEEEFPEEEEESEDEKFEEDDDEEFEEDEEGQEESQDEGEEDGDDEGLDEDEEFFEEGDDDFETAPSQADDSVVMDDLDDSANSVDEFQEEDSDEFFEEDNDNVFDASGFE